MHVPAFVKEPEYVLGEYLKNCAKDMGRLLFQYRDLRQTMIDVRQGLWNAYDTCCDGEARTIT